MYGCWLKAGYGMVSEALKLDLDIYQLVGINTVQLGHRLFFGFVIRLGSQAKRSKYVVDSYVSTFFTDLTQ